MTPADPARPAAAVAALAPPFALAATALQRDGAAAHYHVATAPGLTCGPETLWRAASLSKIVTGRTARIVAGRLQAVPEAIPAEAILGWPLRHPGSGARVTLGQLASHASGLWDEGGYLVPADRRLADWVADHGAAIWSPDPPGARMRYCNLGFVILAACAEVAAGTRFDHLTRDLVLDPLGIRGGFNWSGVADRSDTVPTFRRHGTALVPAVDARIPPRGLAAADGGELALDGYRPGDNPGVFSPQGGLRLSLSDALALARSLTPDPPLWRDGPTADDAGGLFQSWGWGTMILPDPPFWPRPLIGHFGNAYGFRGGLWRDPAAGVSLVHVLNGFPGDDDADDLAPEEELLLAALAKAVG